MKKIAELDPSNEQARKALRHLEPLAAEKREKMKEEMIGTSVSRLLSIHLQTMKEQCKFCRNKMDFERDN
jgi:biotin synthase-like enzyme